MLLGFILVNGPPWRRRHNIGTRMYIHRGAYALLTFGVCGLIYGGAHWLYQQNLANPKTIGNFFATYKVRYDYNRYAGESELNSIENTFTQTPVQAASVADYATSIPVLMYHRISTDNDPYDVTPAAFKAQMFALKKSGYTTVSADDYADFIHGTKKLPAKSILITFDDGTKDSYYPVQPVLKALGFRATNFIITGYSTEHYAGSHYYLSAIELKAMERSGIWDLETHTRYGHSYYQIGPKGKMGEFYPNKLWLKSKHRMETDAEYATRVLGDMTTAKRELESITHKPSTLFAFPFADIGEKHSGNYPAATSILTNDVQHLFKATMMLYYPGRDRSQGYYNSKAVYTYRIQLKLGQWADGQGLVTFINNGEAKSLPYADNFQTDKGWRNAWGQDSAQNGALDISSTPSDSTGGGAVLDGSSDWSNYTMTAQVTLKHGKSLALLTHMNGGPYRMGCYFADNYFSIARNADGSLTTLKQGRIRLQVVNRPQNLGIRVAGDTVQCLENGVVIGEATDHTLPATGGVGFSVWDPHKPSELIIRNVKIVPNNAAL